MGHVRGKPWLPWQHLVKGAILGLQTWLERGGAAGRQLWDMFKVSLGCFLNIVHGKLMGLQHMIYAAHEGIRQLWGLCSR